MNPGLGIAWWHTSTKLIFSRKRWIFQEWKSTVDPLFELHTAGVSCIYHIWNLWFMPQNENFDSLPKINPPQLLHFKFLSCEILYYHRNLETVNLLEDSHDKFSDSFTVSTSYIRNRSNPDPELEGMMNYNFNRFLFQI